MGAFCKFTLFSEFFQDSNSLYFGTGHTSVSSRSNRYTLSGEKVWMADFLCFFCFDTFCFHLLHHRFGNLVFCSFSFFLIGLFYSVFSRYCFAGLWLIFRLPQYQSVYYCRVALSQRLKKAGESGRCHQKLSLRYKKSPTELYPMGLLKVILYPAEPELNHLFLLVFVVYDFEVGINSVVFFAAFCISCAVLGTGSSRAFCTGLLFVSGGLIDLL